MNGTLLEKRIESAIKTWMKRKPPQVHIEILVPKKENNDAELGYSQTMLAPGVMVTDLPGLVEQHVSSEEKRFALIKFIHDLRIKKYVFKT